MEEENEAADKNKQNKVKKKKKKKDIRAQTPQAETAVSINVHKTNEQLLILKQDEQSLVLSSTDYICMNICE